jgi:hypothetical protein
MFNRQRDISQNGPIEHYVEHKARATKEYGPRNLRGPLAFAEAGKL